MSSNNPLDRLRGRDAVNEHDDRLSLHERDDPTRTGGAHAVSRADADSRTDEDLRDGDHGDSVARPTTDGDGVSGASRMVDRGTVVAREKEQYGGIKVGSAFFGWLTATGTAVLLTALAAAAGTALGLATGTDAGEVVNQATRDPQTVGITGAVVLLVILFVAYFCGGYVAGRMARFNGAKQGVAVWLWALAIAVVVAVVGAVAGSQYDVLAGVNGFPRLPVNEGDLTNTGIVAALVAALAALVGAVLGGLAGMRYHRNVDKAGFGH